MKRNELGNWFMILFSVLVVALFPFHDIAIANSPKYIYASLTQKAYLETYLGLVLIVWMVLILIVGMGMRGCEYKKRHFLFDNTLFFYGFFLKHLSHTFGMWVIAFGILSLILFKLLYSLYKTSKGDEK